MFSGRPRYVPNGVHYSALRELFEDPLGFAHAGAFRELQPMELRLCGVPERHRAYCVSDAISASSRWTMCAKLTLRSRISVLAIVSSPSSMASTSINRSVLLC